MATQDYIGGALAENILTMLCFHEEAKLIRSIVTPNLWESAVYRDIAAHAIDFIDQFQQPISEHLPDSMENILNGSDGRKAQSYQRVIDNLFLAKDAVNVQYVISKLHDFVRQQNLKAGVVKAVEAIEAGNLHEAEVVLQHSLRSQVNVFERGLDMADAGTALSFMDDVDDGINTGIAELDKHGITPHKGELYLVVAPMKKGKSWGLIHFGKAAILQRKCVAHVTLEMSEKRCSQRYIQSLFSVTKREALIRVPIFKQDALGRLTDIDYEELKRPTFADPNIKRTLTTKLKKELSKRSPLIIKGFPTGSLTMNELEAWLDGLERFHKVLPDMLIIDYPDLMKIDGKNLRVDTGIVFRELRGLAVRRNIAVVVATQGNRSSMNAKVVKDDMVAEDVSKIATADNVITYSQTEQERKLGLARIWVSNARNDNDKFMILISQCYAAGQFALNSTLMLSDYEEIIQSKDR